ncbi:MAG: hypothetical protein HY305_03310 [Sphingobacteriales bacterium]|nr:hypothetical protein [Sphingobacteriales bacterium]
MKRNFLSLTYCIISFGIVGLYTTGCKKAEDVASSVIRPEIVIRDSRIKVLHLHSDTVYLLTGNLQRLDGETLQIDAGTLIKGNLSTDPNERGSITINPGGTIEANGTSNNPIVFTANAYQGSQLENWSGITIIGSATTDASGNYTEVKGSLKYVRIEFASLTLQTVGSGTTIENIMVSYTNIQPQQSSLSAFNFYGGSFNARNLISYACGGPADFYIADGYNGKLQNIIAYRHPFFGNTGNAPANAVAGVFIENKSATPITGSPVTNPIISNLTVIGPSSQNGSTISYRDTSLRAGALVTTGHPLFRVRNTLLLGYPAAGWYVDDSLIVVDIKSGLSELTHSIVHSNNSNRSFYYSNPDAYNSFSGQGFESLMLDASFNNNVLVNATDFMLEDPFNYDAPNLLPKTNAGILTGADFSGANYSDGFFNKVSYRGALGKDNWLQGWTNFNPLKTNYNFSN